MGTRGPGARRTVCTIVVMALSLAFSGRGQALDKWDDVVVSILTADPGEVCVRAGLDLEVQLAYAPLEASDGNLAPLRPSAPVRVGLDATASRGKVTPASQMVGPFEFFGQRRQVVLRYQALAPGHEDLTVTGSVAGGGSWTATMSFEVVRCKVVVVGTADMSPATNAANQAAGGMWTMGASLDLDGEVLLDDGAPAGTGTVAFSLTGDWTSGVDVFACQLDPQWTGSGTVDVQLDPAQLDPAQVDHGDIDVTLAIGAIQVNATTVSCGGAGGIAVSMDVPPWQVPAATLDLDPVASPGGTDVEDFPYDVYRLPMTVSVVERAV